MIKDIITDITFLKQISKPIKEESEVLDIITDLKDTLNNAKYCLGLSAIQIGHPIRVFCMKVNNSKVLGGSQIEIITFVNPEISFISNENILDFEGCFSFPNQFVRTRRNYKVLIQDLFNKTPMLYEGLGSRVIQHEFDHLNGILFFDRKVEDTSQGRNDLCKCGSGKKFKKCCGK